MKQRRNYLRNITVLLGMMMILGIFPTEVSAADRSFNKTKTVAIDSKEDYNHTGQYIWIKYKASATGYITITAINKIQTTESSTGTGDAAVEEPAFATGEICLYNSKKTTELSQVEAYNTASANPIDYTVSYGVKKNATYYLRVKAEGDVAIKCKLTKVSESSGSKKSKAKSIKKSTTIRGIIPAGDTSADWYKIKVSKKQILHIYYSGNANGKVKFTFSGTYLKTAKKYVDQDVTKLYHTYTTERVQPGTYYVKVERGNSKSSGYYTLKWK